MNQKQPSGDAGSNGTDDLNFEKLVNRARSGDQNAVGDLLERYRNYLLFIANNDVEPQLQAKLAASDAVQESIMHAQCNFDQFLGDSEPEWKAWLTTILANDIRKGKRQFLTRKRDVNLEINIHTDPEVGQILFDEQRTPSSEAIEREKNQALEQAMSQLSEEQRQVIHLRNFERLAFASIGDRMNRSEDAARKFWARSIETLKNLIRSISSDLSHDPEKPRQKNE